MTQLTIPIPAGAEQRVLAALCATAGIATPAAPAAQLAAANAIALRLLTRLVLDHEAQQEVRAKRADPSDPLHDPASAPPTVPFVPAGGKASGIPGA